MRTTVVKDFMVPLEEYATVALNASLFDVVLALEAAQNSFDPSKHKHRAVLVLDERQQVVGKLDMFDILMSLEPRYGELEASGALSRLGYSRDLIQAMLKDHYLWSGTMEFICSRAPNLKVRDFMKTLNECAYIGGGATLDEAIHQMVTCRYQSLLVAENEKVLGVLRLTDVFAKICQAVRACES